jgi:glycosyltransferase involved in cell wall biosynthesis
VDLIVVSLEPWDDVWRRNQHLVSRMLRADPGLRVLFVEPAADPLHDLVSRRRPRRGLSLRAVQGYDGRLLRFRAVKPLPRRLDKRADKRLAIAIERAAASAGMANPVLWINDPGAAPLARRTGWPTLYDITDDWLAADRAQAELDRIQSDEEWLLGNAGEVVVCSQELMRRKRPRRVGAIELIPNAVDVSAYRSPRPRPPDLPSASAVYVGTIHTDRLDVTLCEMTASALRGKGSLVLVGPNALSPADTRRLVEAGVLLLGPRAHDAVIAYLQHSDVLLVPHVVSTFTESLDPIKLYEYAAVGRPVIATAVAGFRDAADPRIHISTDPDDFVAAVGKAVPAVTRFPDCADAAVAGWDERAEAARMVIGRLAARP